VGQKNRENVRIRVSQPKFEPGKLDLFFDPEDGGDIFLRNVG
jgi:hypothetical protein